MTSAAFAGLGDPFEQSRACSVCPAWLGNRAACAVSVFVKRVACVHAGTSVMPSLLVAPFPLLELVREQSTCPSLLLPHGPIPSSLRLWCTGAEMCSDSRAPLAFLLTDAAAVNPTTLRPAAQELGG